MSFQEHGINKDEGHASQSANVKNDKLLQSFICKAPVLFVPLQSWQT